MLREFASVRQIPGEGFRRWFTDQDFDLYVWYNDQTMERVLGFQLCYDKRGREKALTWYRDKGYLHTAIDDGETTPWRNQTPILVADGQFPRQKVLEQFRSAGRMLESSIFKLVEERLASYQESLR